MSGGGKALLRRPKDEQRALIAIVRQWVAERKPDSEMLDMLTAQGIGVRELATLKRLAEDEERAEVEGRDGMQVFLEYRRDQLQVVKALDDFVEKVKGENSYLNAVPGALRAKADVIDRVLKAGQDLGVITRKPKESVFLGGLIVGEMSDSQIADKLSEINAHLARIARAADAPMLPAGGYSFTRRPDKREGAVDDEKTVEAEAGTVKDEKPSRKGRKRPVRRRPA